MVLRRDRERWGRRPDEAGSLSIHRRALRDAGGVCRAQQHVLRIGPLVVVILERLDVAARSSISCSVAIRA